MPEATKHEDAIALRIEKNTEAERKKIISEAKKEGRRLVKEAKKGTKAESERIIDRKLRELQYRKETEISAIAADAKKGLMNVKSRMVDGAFSQATKGLLELPRREYRDFLSALILRGASSLDTKEVVVTPYEGDDGIFVPSYLAGIEKELEKKRLKIRLRLSQEKITTPGVALASGDGKVALDMTIEELFRDAREELSAEVEKILFGR